MHIPDGFLDLKTAAAGGVLSATGLGFALRQLRREATGRRVPLIGLAAAFIFVAQMLNFPVAGGTSGHLIGGTLAAVLVGPGAAILAMSCVLILQCLLFADGGLLALGANVFNMAILAPLVGYAIYYPLHRVLPGLRGRLIAVAFASWCSVVATSVSCAGQLALSDTVPWRVVLPAMTTVHMLIGLGEAGITTLIVAAVAHTRPELLPDRASSSAMRIRWRQTVGYGLLLAVGLAFFVAPFASPWPDGLERVAATLGFEHRALVTDAPITDYILPGIAWSPLAIAVAGMIGVVVAFLFAFGLARALTRRRDVGAEGVSPT